MTKIDIVDIKNAVKSGEIVFYIDRITEIGRDIGKREKIYIMCKNKAGEVVNIGRVIYDEE